MAAERGAVLGAGPRVTAQVSTPVSHCFVLIPNGWTWGNTSTKEGFCFGVFSPLSVKFFLNSFLQIPYYSGPLLISMSPKLPFIKLQALFGHDRCPPLARAGLGQVSLLLRSPPYWSIHPL